MAKNSQELAASAAAVTTAEMGEKVRVHALAKALGIPSAELITVLDGQGIQGKRAQSTLPRQQVAEVLDTLKNAGSAPAEKPVGKKAPAKKAPAKKPAAKKTTARKAPVEKDAEQKPAAKKTTARKAPVEKDAEQKPAAKKTTARKAPEQTPAEQKQSGTKSAEQTPAKKTQAKKGPARKTAAKKKAETPAAPVTPEASTTDTVDALIDRIADSVEKSATVSTGKTDETTAQPADTAAGQTTGEPRKVRRRVVRRVGSRTAASDAELLRSRKAGQDDRKGGASTQDASKSGAGDGTDRSGGPVVDRDRYGDDDRDAGQGGRSRRRGRRGRGRGRGDQDRENQAQQEEVTAPASADAASPHTAPQEQPAPTAQQAPQAAPEPADDHGVPEGLPVLTEGADIVDEPVKLKGSTRLESKKRWRQEQGHDKKKIVSKAEFLARRENVDRAMVVRDSKRSDHPGTTTQVGITEDGMLVEHVVTSETQSSIIGNIYLGRVQNVLSSMEAAFIDIGTGRNAVLYAGEVDWRNRHLHARTRRIEAALKPGDQVLVQAIKDPLGHKGARLTNRLSFAGRYLVYVPGGKTQGISRKLPEAERKRLKDILGRVVPDNGGTIIRTAAEGVSEELIAEDVNRLHQRWLDIQDAEDKARARKGTHPVTMYEEPNMLVKVIRDIFNEDFNELVVDGDKSWAVVRDYVHRMAPDLESRVVRYHPEEHGGRDVFADRQLDEQLAKALSRKVWLPSGGYLIIDRTEAMTVIDVNTGSFVGSGGNLEETVTLTNLEAAEEIVRQMRLRDMGGMIVVDFIDMVLPENRDLMLRRLSEFLGRDRTRHKVSEVTSLGLVQMTRKRLGTGLLETFSTECPTCEGRGVIIHDDPVEHVGEEDDRHGHHDRNNRQGHNHSERRDHGNREEKRQARQQQETKRRHEQAREDRAKDAEEKPSAPAVTREHSEGPGHGDHGDRQERQPHGNRSRRTRRGSRSGATTHEVPRNTAHEDRPEPENRPGPAEKKDAGHDDRTVDRATDVGQSRRGRRRVVRRAENPGENDRASEVAAIAAQAVEHAGIEDPDEPTGADYVPDVEPSTDDATRHGESGRQGTDRRGRRRVRRVVRPAAGRSGSGGTPTTPAPTVTPEQHAPEAPQEVPAPGQASTSTPAGQSYAEAKDEFDASPRRRRRTRGRSRSDVAPQPTDFPDGGTPRSEGSTSGRPAGKTATASAVPAVTSGKTASAPVQRRGRRRVVRSSRH